MINTNLHSKLSFTKCFGNGRGCNSCTERHNLDEISNIIYDHVLDSCTERQNSCTERHNLDHVLDFIDSKCFALFNICWALS